MDWIGYLVFMGCNLIFAVFVFAFKLDPIAFEQEQYWVLRGGVLMNTISMNEEFSIVFCDALVASLSDQLQVEWLLMCGCISSLSRF